MKKVPLNKPEPDIRSFVNVILGRKTPRTPPLIELFLDYEIVREIGRSHLHLDWVEPGTDRKSMEKYYLNWIEVYYRMGYDYVRAVGAGGLEFPAKPRTAADTSTITSRGTRYWAEETRGPISTWKEYEEYPWPDPSKFDYRHYEFIGQHLPEGMGLFICPSSGFLEIPLDTLFGYENLCFLMYDQPDLVTEVFRRVGEILTAYYEHLIGLPKLAGFFQGDDMGFKTSTMVPPGFLRTHVFPWHKKLAKLAHDHNLIYLLHACGNLNQVTDELIDDVKIDGRHSFEDEGNPVVEFKRKYGARTATLGGIDLDKLCRLPEDALRKHVRKIIGECLPGGRFAVGAGNSVTNYVPVQNYFAMVEEALNYE
jgi:uroporphyrinogen decarboxylase